MSIRQTIDKLKLALVDTTAEDELLETITVLQQELLEEITAVSNALRSFINIRDDVSVLSGFEEYQSVMKDLVEIKESLSDLPVQKRVNKEIRELQERGPRIRQIELQNRRPKKDEMREWVSLWKRNHRC